MLTTSGLLKAANEGRLAGYLGSEVASNKGSMVPVTNVATMSLGLRMSALALRSKGKESTRVRTAYGVIPEKFPIWRAREEGEASPSPLVWGQVCELPKEDASPSWVFVHYTGSAGHRDVVLRHSSASTGQTFGTTICCVAPELKMGLQQIVMKTTRGWSLQDISHAKPLAPGLIGPGVLFWGWKIDSMQQIVNLGGEAAARIVRCALATAINATKRNTVQDVYDLFGGDGEDWKRIQRRRIANHSDRENALLASVRLARAKILLAQRSMREKKPLVARVFKVLDGCVEKGELVDWKVDQNHTWLLFPEYLVSCVEDEWKGKTYPKGLYKLPRPVVKISHAENASNLKVYLEDGNIYPHPHVVRGRRGTPCWGETKDATERNMALVQDLWDGEPEEFVSFMSGLFVQMYEEGHGGRGLYAPFQTWGKKVDGSS